MNNRYLEWGIYPKTSPERIANLCVQDEDD
jgi:hypothetical protein